MPDKVMHPKQTGNTPGIAKQVNRGIVKGPTASVGTAQPFNRKKK